jgi:hypothetical protein
MVSTKTPCKRTEVYQSIRWTCILPTWRLMTTSNAKLVRPMVSRRYGVKHSNRDVRILKMIQGAGSRRLLAIQIKLQNSWTGGWRPKNVWRINCIRREIIYHILHKDLGKFISHSLADEKTNKVIIGDEFFPLPQTNLYFLNSMFTPEESWVDSENVNHSPDKRLVIHK